MRRPISAFSPWQPSSTARPWLRLRPIEIFPGFRRVQCEPLFSWIFSQADRRFLSAIDHGISFAWIRSCSCHSDDSDVYSERHRVGPQQISTIVFTCADTIRLATAAALGGRLGRAFDTHPFDCRQISGDRQPRPGCDYRSVARERTRVAEEALDAAKAQGSQSTNCGRF